MKYILARFEEVLKFTETRPVIGKRFGNTTHCVFYQFYAHFVRINFSTIYIFLIFQRSENE